MRNSRSRYKDIVKPAQFTTLCILFFLIVFVLFDHNFQIYQNETTHYITNFSHSHKNIDLFADYFPPLKIYCYNISKRWRPDNKKVRTLTCDFEYESKQFVEIELHRELMLSPFLTNDPGEADLFYIPAHTYSCQKSPDGFNLSLLIEELRSIGQWYDRKNGTDHIIATSLEAPYVSNAYNKSVTNHNFIIASPNPQVGSAWKTWHGQRNIVIPFLSYFPNHPPEKVDWTRHRNYTAFIAQNCSANSSKVCHKAINLVHNMSRSKVILFSQTKNSIVETVKLLPQYYHDSDFCIFPRGDFMLPSKRVFDSIYFGCIPVFISEPMKAPFEDVYLNYSKFSIRIPEDEIEKMPEVLQSYTQEQVQEMRNELKHAAKTFRFSCPENAPPKVGEAFWAFSWMLYIRHLYQKQYHRAYFPPVLPKVTCY